MTRYQSFLKEWDQAAQIQAMKAKIFKEAVDVLGASSTTIIRRFKKAMKQLSAGVTLPKAIAIDEYKADTDAGKYQLIIANAETYEAIDILPNRRNETIKQYLATLG